MAVACWAARCSFVDFERSVVSDRRADSDGFLEELVGTAVGTVCSEKLDSLGGR